MLSIILPTYNEAANLPELLQRIVKTLPEDSFEIIVVDDDSPDKTWRVAEELRESTYVMLRVLRREGVRGLSSAVVEGFGLAEGDILLVMDSDLQHDPKIILNLLAKIQKGADIAVASRYAEGGSVGDWITGRRILSKIATFLARKLPNIEVTDPMSGFFAIKKSAFESIARDLRPTGFKILLEILSFLPRGTKVAEVPLHFQKRKYGHSKLNIAIELQFILQMLRIALHRWQWIIFWSLCLLAALVLCIRVFAILPLYVSSSVRNHARDSLTFVAKENGWLLSDIIVRKVGTSDMSVIHRPHHRGRDERTCYTISYDHPEAIPCQN